MQTLFTRGNKSYLSFFYADKVYLQLQIDPGKEEEYSET